MKFQSKVFLTAISVFFATSNLQAIQEICKSTNEYRNELRQVEASCAEDLKFLRDPKKNKEREKIWNLGGWSRSLKCKVLYWTKHCKAYKKLKEIEGTTLGSYSHYTDTIEHIPAEIDRYLKVEPAKIEASIKGLEETKDEKAREKLCRKIGGDLNVLQRGCKSVQAYDGLLMHMEALYDQL